MNFLSLDGDGIGRVIEFLVLTNQLDKLKVFSESIHEVLTEIREKALSKGGEVIFHGGDSIMLKGTFDVKDAEDMIRHFEKKTGKTASAGIGSTPQKVYIGLKIAKSKGGNQVHLQL